MQNAACKDMPLTYQKGFFHYLTGFQNLHKITTHLSLNEDQHCMDASVRCAGQNCHVLTYLSSKWPCCLKQGSNCRVSEAFVICH